MQLNNLFAFATLGAFVAADCYGSGADWYDKDEAASIANSACNLQLGGTYGPESTYNGQKASCFNTPNGKIDLVVTHISEGELLLPQDECYDGLQKEIYGCSKGGESSYTNWRYKYAPIHKQLRKQLAVVTGATKGLLTVFLFRADPNEGSC